ncbi:MAG: anaerobic ribonucleoside-triphosphate reductase activating protein [Clostridia bacterium]|nr:anaerobic ribonucleoside-triphosphate reductase activating protein [Clostridia bacterium]
MFIKAYQKLTLLDFPGKIACTVFTAGCNLRCPFCHNALLVTDIDDAFVPEEEFFTFLSGRKGRLDGVAITGGEPLMQKDIASFIAEIKAMGFLVKLDTNGTFPDKLDAILKEGNVDYVAMDIKNSLLKYAKTVAVPKLDTALIKKSVKIIKDSGVDYEFRTTVTHEDFEKSDFEEIGKLISGAKRYYLQAFKDSGNLIAEGNTAETKEVMEEYKRIAEKYVGSCQLRGV